MQNIDYEGAKVLNLRNKALTSLPTLKRAIRKQLKTERIKIREEICESLLKEIFLEVKERISHRTEYKVNEIDFPKDYLFALLFSKEDFKSFLRFALYTQKKRERKRTEKAWKREYPREKLALEERIKGITNVCIPLKRKRRKQTFFLIGLSSENRKSLRHELTHYFEVTLKIPEGSLMHIWM